MKKLLTEWRKFLNEMISTQDLKAFDEKYSNPEEVENLAKQLSELGWDSKAIEHHKGEQPPYAEIRNVILNIDKYRAPKKAEIISAQKLFMDDETLQDREKKYQDYKSGKIKKYFRDDDRSPDEMDFENLSPITVVEEPGGKLEVADGNHRAFLAKKNNKSLPAWIIRLK